MNPTNTMGRSDALTEAVLRECLIALDRKGQHSATCERQNQQRLFHGPCAYACVCFLDNLLTRIRLALSEVSATAAKSARLRATLEQIAAEVQCPEDQHSTNLAIERIDALCAAAL